MPAGADTCVMQEDTTLDGDFVIIPKGLKPGANTRKAGEDVKVGEVMLSRASVCGRRTWLPLRPPVLTGSRFMHHSRSP
jgi:molybdopterin biosynthesis enzyme